MNLLNVTVGAGLAVLGTAGVVSIVDHLKDKEKREQPLTWKESANLLAFGGAIGAAVGFGLIMKATTATAKTIGELAE